VESKKEIMEATNTALRKYGYSEISIQKIADEFPKSKSLLYHHYDSKDDILLDLIDQTLEEFTENCIEIEKNSPEKQLREKAFIGFNQENDIAKAMMEIRTQGIRDKRYRDRFKKFSKTYRHTLEKLIKRTDMEESEVKPEKAAIFIDSVNREAMFAQATEEEIASLEKELEIYIENRILNQ
jgi:AcrR family transcriptional regulator